ncbi:cytochrome c [Rhodocytophaga rosea]|uniref:Cytochrome c n=1 Tax=Rhodocytophaga rosea TaxID=2704465 RepID=A0A6C0GKR6_9BACT|nr:c-type cytochrome [Rhodocytophaga rosea]QHT68608.1 cytochrome c [Rhodocytophaga rosea]
MKKAGKILAVITGIVLAFLLYVQLTYQQTYEVPVTGLKASTDLTIIARGKYLAMGPAHCWTCHVEDPSSVDLIKETPAMSGGLLLDLPWIATLRTPNITSDKKTGIGRYSDDQLAQVIRYNRTPKGHALVPFMTYNAMSDADIVAILSYLRSTKPIEKAIPEHNFTMLGKLLMRFVIKPDVTETHQQFAALKPDTTAGYGKYLAYTVTNCNGCHTERGPAGEFVGEPFAGGHKRELQTGTFVVPNLTPDPQTGRIYHWNQQTFINRFRMGKVYQEDFMPWRAYQQMNDNDLKAIYNFLQTLKPVTNKIEQTYIPLAEN